MKILLDFLPNRRDGQPCLIAPKTRTSFNEQLPFYSVMPPNRKSLGAFCPVWTMILTYVLCFDFEIMSEVFV